MFRRACGLVLVWTVTALAASSADEDIVAEGQGIGANKQEALIAAKRDAVEKGIGMLLLSQTEIENFMVKRDQVITKTMGAVRSYEILKEGKASDGSYEIRIRAVLARQTMREDLAAFHILIESMNKPRVMVVIRENNVGNDQPTNDAAETAIIKFLRDPYNFEIVDPGISADIKKSQQRMAELDGDARAAAAIGSQYGAEVLITGTAISREATALSQNLGGLISVQGDVTLKAINCSNARIIATASGHGAQAHVAPNTAGTMAIDKAATKAIKEMLDAIIKDWQDQLNNGITVRLTVQNVGTYRLKSDILQTLGAMNNVTAVRERSWNAESRLLEVDVQYRGNVDGLCSRLDGFKLRSGSGSLSVTGVSGMAVTVRAQPL